MFSIHGTEAKAEDIRSHRNQTDANVPSVRT